MNVRVPYYPSLHLSPRDRKKTVNKGISKNRMESGWKEIFSFVTDETPSTLFFTNDKKKRVTII